MSTPAQRWEDIYNQTPLCEVPRHFAGMRGAPFLLEYLTMVLRHCPRGGRTCETGIGSGYGAIWLSQRGILAEGIDYSAGIVERARQVNNILAGSATFHVGDLFEFYEKNLPRYHVIHHQGVLEHFTVPMIRAALAQQVACADHVVFSVPSVNYPFDPEFGDERLLPLEEWRIILEPFQVQELKYYGDPRLGAEEQIMCVLRGQPVDDALLALMRAHEQPYPEGISAIVHTRNEARHIGPCLETLQPWVDEIIVCDMESDDATLEIAQQFTGKIIRHPRIANFDRARNVSAMRAKYRWVFFLDADERVPPGLGPALRHMIAEAGDSFEASLIPFRHYFSGHWMQCLYPGYTAPRLLKNGKFIFNPRLHSGAHVDGRVIAFPADNPDLALAHYSFDSMSHYLDKLNRYTDGEAANMYQDGQPYHWQNAIRHFVHDFQSYYDQGQATKDGVHGFIYSFFSAFYRFDQHAKLFEHRHKQQHLHEFELSVPRNVEEVLEFALAVARQKPRPTASEIRIADTAGAAPVVWCGPLFDPSGYGEESRHLLFALKDAGQNTAAQLIPWSDDEAPLGSDERERLQELADRPVKPGFVQIVHNFAPFFTRHPQAGAVVGRTIFETDRLPQDWVQACNRMDQVWVPTEFNRQTFADAGVNQQKLVVVPECIDTAPYQDLTRTVETPPVVQEIANSGRVTFLSIFDWTLHKGWDLLLRAFIEEFKGQDDVSLVLKVWSTMGYDAAAIKEQAAEYVRKTLDYDLVADRRIQFVSERFSPDGLLALYRACDAYVMPSRGEGWGRPYMEAMACGLPTIGTGWSGNTAFMNAENSYLLDYELQGVPEEAWREVVTYKGHRWAEPNLAHLRRTMRRILENPAEAKVIGQAARTHVLTHFSREAVGPLIMKAIQNLQTGSSPITQHPHRDAAPLRVRWEGAQWNWHSLAHVNREFCLGLVAGARETSVELSVISTEPPQFAPTDQPQFLAIAERGFAPLSGPADVHVRHHFPPRFDKPSEGHLVLIQPWEYGYLPSDWIEPIRQNVREVWCHSQYVKNVYLASGIPEEKLQMAPLGVDTTVFHPKMPPFVFTIEHGAEALNPQGAKPFVFLFVGGTIPRKGIDILLDAYLRAFSAADDVCLVIKDTGTQTVYPDNAGPRIHELIADSSRPRIVYLDTDLTAHQLAGVYTAADCLVQPYRGEGFCLPVLEAMACGIPAIVPEGGSTDDFVDETVGWRIPAEHKPMSDSNVGPWECVGQPWMLEVNVDDLAKLMRSVRTQPKEIKRRGAAAAKRVQKSWTWRQATAVIQERLLALQKEPAPTALTITDGEGSPLLPESYRRASTEALQSEPERSVFRPAAKSKKKKAVSRAVNQPTISLCMIVRNEERVLGACLESIKPWVDEIVVVDTGSTDRTVEIAQQHGAQVHHFPWTNSFSEARNVSLSHATGDWILWMDADDTIPEECGRRLHDLTLMAEDKLTGILMQVHIPPAPGETGFTIVDHVKLFRNLPELRFEGRIHEQILEPIYRIGGTVQRSDLYVVHSGYDYSPEGQQHKRCRDLLLLELDLADRPDHPFVLFNIGMTAFHMKDFAKAREALERCMAVSLPQESTMRKVHAMLAGCHLEQGDIPGAKARIESGLQLFPHDPELLFRAGIIYYQAGELEAAERSYIKLLTNREVGHIDSLDVSMTGFKAHHNLALVYQDLGRLPEAERHWRTAIELEPNFIPSQIGLRDLLLRQVENNGSGSQKTKA